VRIQQPVEFLGDERKEWRIQITKRWWIQNGEVGQGVTAFGSLVEGRPKRRTTTGATPADIDEFTS